MIWVYILEELIMAIILFIVALAAHEYGHRRTAQSLGYKAQTFFGKQGLYTEIDDSIRAFPKHERKVLWAGVWWGFFVIIFSCVICPGFSLFFLIAYYLGTQKDMNRLRIIKNKK